MIRQNDENSFWLEDISSLFSSGKLIPKNGDTFECQMNALTRLLMLTCVILMLFYSLSKSLKITGVMIFCIVCTYYFGKLFSPKSFIKEPYGNVPNVVEANYPPPIYSDTNPDLIITPTYDQINLANAVLPSNGEVPISLDTVNPSFIDGRESSKYCYGEKAGACPIGVTDVQCGQNFTNGIPLEETVSASQKLVGQMNPKALVQPVIPSPIYDFDTWRPNDFAVPMGINDQKTQELFSNGYVVSSDTIPTSQVPNYLQTSSYRTQNHPGIYRLGSEETNGQLYPGELSSSSVENYQSPPQRTSLSDLKRGYKSLDYPALDFGCGYQPINLENNLPSNYQANECQYGKRNAKYNNDLFEIPIQPGIYTKSQVNQPDASMSNLGISFVQPFEPTTFTQQNGYKSFIELDPYQNEIKLAPTAETHYRRDMYDPRTTGYGTQYRSYVDPLLGQPRYYYRDVDQENNGGYLTRNNVDFANFGTATGNYPFDKPLEGNALHQYADNTYTNSNVGFRTELQQRLMHKNSNREWQQRIAPIRTNVQNKGFMGTSGAKTYAGPRGG